MAVNSGKSAKQHYAHDFQSMPKVAHTAVATDEADAAYLVCRDAAIDASGKPTTVEV